MKIINVVSIVIIFALMFQPSPRIEATPIDSLAIIKDQVTQEQQKFFAMGKAIGNKLATTKIVINETKIFIRKKLK